MVKSSSSRDLSQIKKDILSLKSDVKNLAKDVGKDNRRTLSNLRNRVSDLGSSINDRVPDSISSTYHSALEHGEEAVDTTRKQVEKYPLTSLLGALIVGAALTALVIRPGR
jgi:ElaB/YqjD/DUF883 family membrane-anchored ribosome-binding protein